MAPPCGRVLVVENQAPARALVEKLLADAGHEVVVADDATRSLELIRTRRPDVVLLDLVMPALDGLEILDRLAADPRLSLIPVVVVSAASSTEQVVEALQRGAHDYVTKPFDPEILQARVAAALRARRRSQELQAAAEQLRTQAMADPLTGLSNRRHGELALPQMIATAARADHMLSVLKIDIDGFKAVNDTYGHAAGDEALREFARRLQTRSRTSDLLVRWGGDEFVAILPDASAAGALLAAESMLRQVRSRAFEVGDSGLIAVTASIGVAQWRSETACELLARADGALYRAKSNGRDQAFVAGADSRFGGSRRRPAPAPVTRP